MAAKARPWMRWHVTRWRNSPSVMKMSLAAQGAYRNLLEAAWQQGGRLPNDRELFWRYAFAQSPQEFAAVAEQVLRMFDVSECGNWLTNETLTEECAATVDHAAELSRKRSEAGKRGNEVRWGTAAAPSQAGSQKESQSGSQNIANAGSPASNPVLDEEDTDAASQTIAKNRINNNKADHLQPLDRTSGDKSIEVAQWKCMELGLASPRWTRPPEALCAFDGALQSEQRQNPSHELTAIADELGELWLEYTRSGKGSRGGAGERSIQAHHLCLEGEVRRAGSQRGTTAATAGRRERPAEEAGGGSESGPGDAESGDRKKRPELVDRRTDARWLQEQYRVSERRVCGLLWLAVSSYRYQSQRSDEALRSQVLELAREKPRSGYRRLHVLLQRSGAAVNHKRLYRIYREAGLCLRRKKRKHCMRACAPLRALTAANQEWPWILPTM